MKYLKVLIYFLKSGVFSLISLLATLQTEIWICVHTLRHTLIFVKKWSSSSFSSLTAVCSYSVPYVFGSYVPFPHSQWLLQKGSLFLLRLYFSNTFKYCSAIPFLLPLQASKVNLSRVAWSFGGKENHIWQPAYCSVSEKLILFCCVRIRLWW